MLGVKFNSKMLWAWFFLALLLVGMVLLRLIRPDESVAMKFVLFVTCILNAGILVFLVRFFRGPNRNWRDPSENGEPLSAWGYFWRAYIAFFSQFPVLVLANLLLPGAVQVNRFSAVEVALWEVPFVLASTVGAWLLFSRDRIGQAKALLAGVRGY